MMYVLARCRTVVE